MPIPSEIVVKWHVKVPPTLIVTIVFTIASSVTKTCFRGTYRLYSMLKLAARTEKYIISPYFISVTNTTVGRV